MVPRLRLFSEDFAQSFTDAAHDHLVWAVSNPPPILPEMTQSSSIVSFMDLHSGNYKRHWWVQARWDGTVGIHYSTEIEPVTAEQMASGPVKEAWAAASALVRQLGGYGDAYFALRTKGGAGMRTLDGKNLDANIRRGPFSIVPDDEMVASVERELRRAAGETVYEPS
jgi:hypothetical protein